MKKIKYFYLLESLSCSVKSYLSSFESHDVTGDTRDTQLHTVSVSLVSHPLRHLCLPQWFRGTLNTLLCPSSTLCPLLSPSACLAGLAPLASEAQLPLLHQTVGTFAPLHLLRASAIPWLLLCHLSRVKSIYPLTFVRYHCLFWHLAGWVMACICPHLLPPWPLCCSLSSVLLDPK